MSYLRQRFPTFFEPPNLWQTLNSCTILSTFTVPYKEWMDPLCSAKTRLKNTTVNNRLLAIFGVHTLCQDASAQMPVLQYTREVLH